jgi:hypothetical protein
LLLKADEWVGGLPHREQQHGNRTTKSGKSHAAAPHSNRVTIAEQPFRTIRQRTIFSRIKMLPISPHLTKGVEYDPYKYKVQTASTPLPSSRLPPVE